MAKAHESLKCFICKAEIKFIPNSSPSNVVGDPGGHHEDHQCPKGALEEFQKQTQNGLSSKVLNDVEKNNSNNEKTTP
jgi:hypothetical protein